MINVYTQVLDASLRTAVDRIGSELFTIVDGSELRREVRLRPYGASARHLAIAGLIKMGAAPLHRRMSGRIGTHGDRLT